jgi:thiosulfate dehydrogenase [quinone] large subunit
MTESSASNPSISSRCEYTAAFLLLRLFLGLRTLMAGLEKFELNRSYSTENYSANMTRMATGISNNSVIPLWAAKVFAQPLGYLLIVFGVLVLLGVKSRVTLFLTGLIYVGLSFGLMAVGSIEGEGIAWLGMHVLMFAVALVLARHDRFALWRDKFD